MRDRREHGFTLVELMVVIVLIGLLAGAVGVNVFGILIKGKKTIAKDELKKLQTAIELYYIEKHDFPPQLSDLTTPSDETGEPFMDEIPKDPWDEDYVYDPTGGTRRKYIILCKGEDRIEGTDDDISTESSEQKGSQ
jgi:general secretion pathway protein G